MNYKLGTVRKFKTEESFEAEGCRFYEGKVYGVLKELNEQCQY